MGIVLRALIAVGASAFTLAVHAKPYGQFDGAQGAFGSAKLDRGQFTSTFSFNVPADGVLSGWIVPDDDVTALTYARLTGPHNLIVYFRMEISERTDQRALAPQKMRPGIYTIEVRGLSQEGGGYQGGLRFERFSILPEPSAWLLMVIGFGGLGFTLRRRRMDKRRIRFQ